MSRVLVDHDDRKIKLSQVFGRDV